MRRKQLLRIMVGVFAIVAVTLVLGASIDAQVKYKVLHKFAGGADGGDPEDTLTFDASGNLYGTTWGTIYSTVFEMSPNPDGTWTETVLYTFSGENDPSSVRANVIFDASGNMYGTSVSGGDYGQGTVWQLSPNPGGPWTETILDSFTDGSDGGWLVGGLIFDAAGNLYGAASHGGAYGNGVVFELSPNSDGTWTENELYSFTGGMDGAGPDHPNLVFDSAGNLYGVTVGGGEGTCSFIFWSQCGVVYELTPNGDGTWTESVLYRFTGGKDGGQPESTLAWDAEGNLYGTAMHGGLYNNGVVFKLTPGSGGVWTEAVLHHFKGGTDGANPIGGVVLDAAGNLYGTTEAGGGRGSCTNWFGMPGCGTAFELTPNSQGRWTERVLHRFQGGLNAPFGEVVLDEAGNLYGTASGETGSSGHGGVFEITP